MQRQTSWPADRRSSSGRRLMKFARVPPACACRTELTHRCGNTLRHRGWPLRKMPSSPIIRCSGRTSVPRRAVSGSRPSRRSRLRDRPPRDSIRPPWIFHHRGRLVAADARGRGLQGGRPRDRCGSNPIQHLPARLFPRRGLRLRIVDVQHLGDDPRPGVASPGARGSQANPPAGGPNRAPCPQLLA